MKAGPSQGLRAPQGSSAGTREARLGWSSGALPAALCRAGWPLQGIPLPFGGSPWRFPLGRAAPCAKVQSMRGGIAEAARKAFAIDGMSLVFTIVYTDVL